MKPDAANRSALAKVWGQRSQLPFDGWVRAVADAMELSELKLESASRHLKTNPAELEAVLQLALLGDEELLAIGKNAPPRTTWFTLAGMDAAEIRRALAILKTRKPGQSPSSMLKEFDPTNAVASRVEQISLLEGKVFKALSAKAKRYGLLKDMARKALFDFGRRRDTDQPLSDKQASWAESLITQLIDGGAIKRKSPDGDADLCDPLLDLFGK